MILGGQIALLPLLWLIFLGLIGYSTCFNCFKCTSMLSTNSTCDLSPGDLEVMECDTYCFTEIMTAAAVHIYVMRGCTQQFDCTEESTCRELAHSGNCKACCREDWCNKYTGREVAANSMESMGVSRYRGNHRWALFVTTLSVAAYLSLLYSS